jgi:hypothetical protein
MFFFALSIKPIFISFLPVPSEVLFLYFFGFFCMSFAPHTAFTTATPSAPARITSATLFYLFRLLQLSRFNRVCLFSADKISILFPAIPALFIVAKTAPYPI